MFQISKSERGLWQREANRGNELDGGKTVGIIGYGHMGKAFAKKLRGFDVEVLCYDIKPNVGDENAQQVSLKTLQEKAEILSLHVPHTKLTNQMIDASFIQKFEHPFWLINTARGSCVVTDALVEALESKRILGAGLDVLEYEKSSFETLFLKQTTSRVKLFIEIRECDAVASRRRLDGRESPKTCAKPS